MSELRPLTDCLVEAVHWLERTQAGVPPVRGFHTGLAAVDALEPRLTAGLTILSGRAAVGKTAFLLRAALETARRGATTAVFTADASGALVAARLMIAAAELRVPRGSPGSMSREAWSRVMDASERLSRLPIWLRELRPCEPDLARRAFTEVHRAVQPGFAAFDGIPWARASILSTLYALWEEHRIPILAAVRDDGELFAPRTLEPLRFAAPSWTTVFQLECMGSGPEPHRADLALLLGDNDGERHGSVPLVLDKPVAWVREARPDERPPVEM